MVHAYKEQNGFTIIEMIVVTVVIAILAMITVVSFNKVQQQARDGQVKAELANAHHARDATRQRMAETQPPPEQRLAELELRFMEQQKLLEDLSSVVYAQQQTIDLAHARIAQLEKKLSSEPGLVDARADERPPHY